VLRVVAGSIAGVLVAIAAILFALYVRGTFEPSLGSQLRKVERGAQTGWYLGPRFHELRLTDVEPAKAERVATFGYGDCRRVGTKWNPFSPTSCGFPLLVQTWRISGPTVGPDFVPTLPDGTCSRLRLRGVPAAAGPTGVVLYTDGEAVALLGPPELVKGAVAALRPAGRSGTATLPQPTNNAAAALADCSSKWHPFEPLQARIRRLLRASKLPLVSAGAWFRDAQLVGADEAAGAVSLDYESCGAHADFDQCKNSLLIVSEPAHPRLVAGDLRGASCERFSLSAAPGVVWHNPTSSSDEAGIYLFTGHAVLAAAHDFTLENVNMGRVRAAAKALRPLDRTTLPAPAYDAARLLGLCGKTKTI
jgi:hypothetical protein